MDLSEYILEPLSVQPMVFVVHNDIPVRESLESLIRCESWQSETFAFAGEFLARPRVLVPNCLVLDVSLRDLNGLDLQRRVVAERPDTPVIFVTGHGDVPTSVQAMKAGAIEFLMSPFRDEALISAIREGFKRSSIALNREAGMRSLRDRYTSLSHRERQVMSLVVSGLLNKEVGAELAISEITVKAHRGQVMRKMRADSFADLVRMAARLRSELALLAPGPVPSPPSPERTCGLISIDSRHAGTIAVGQGWDETAKHAGRCVKAVRQENRQGGFGLAPRKKPLAPSVAY
jgi:FixJ family two-component response regulator